MTEGMIRELLIWGSAIGIFFAGFALGVTVIVIHAKILASHLPIPKELMPVLIPAPPPLPPSAPTTSPFSPKTKPAVGFGLGHDLRSAAERRAASAATKDAYLTEIDRLVTEARAKRKSKLAADELPPLPTRTAALPSIWNDDPHDPQEMREERKTK